MNNNRWEYLQWTDDEKEAILKLFDRNLKTVKEDVKSIREWMTKQPHLNNYKVCDNMIEFMLIYNKFRIEVTKKRIDLYFSIRSFFPEYFDKMDTKSLTNIMSLVNIATTQKLTKNQERIVLCNLASPDSLKYSATEYFSYFLKIIEVRLLYDCAITDYFIFDYKDFSINHLAQFTPLFIKKLVTVMESVYALRSKGMYVINATSTIDTVVAILKSFVKPKIAARIKTFQDASILFDLLPKSQVPKDYGGDGLSMRELAEIWKEKLKEVDPWIETLQNNPVNEKLRPDKQLTHDYFGIEGNFRKLNVD